MYYNPKMRLNLIITCMLILAFSGIQAQQNVTLNVTVKGIKKVEGQLVMALFVNEKDFLEKDYKNLYIKVNKKDQITVEWPALAPHSYSLSIFHDINNNGKLDTNWMGIPIEPYGFSNDARGTFGPPSFEDCLFNLKEDKAISITLH